MVEQLVGVKCVACEIIDHHPMFVIEVTSHRGTRSSITTEVKQGRTSTRSVRFRFNAFREFHRALSPEAQQLVSSDAPFPYTFTRNKLGFKASQKMLEQRRQGLSRWLAAVGRQYEQMPSKDRAHVDAFLCASRRTSTYVNKSSLLPVYSFGSQAKSTPRQRSQRPGSKEGTQTPTSAARRDSLEHAGSWEEETSEALDSFGAMPGTLKQGAVICGGLAWATPLLHKQGHLSIGHHHGVGGGGTPGEHHYDGVRLFMVLSHLAIHIFEPLASKRVRPSDQRTSEDEAGPRHWSFHFAPGSDHSHTAGEDEEGVTTGRLLTTMPLSEVMRVDARPGAMSFQVQDVDCRMAAFVTSNASQAQSWMRAISSAMRRFSDLSQRLDLRATGHLVWGLSVRHPSEVPLGPASTGAQGASAALPATGVEEAKLQTMSSASGGRQSSLAFSTSVAAVNGFGVQDWADIHLDPGLWEGRVDLPVFQDMNDVVTIHFSFGELCFTAGELLSQKVEEEVWERDRLMSGSSASVSQNEESLSSSSASKAQTLLGLSDEADLSPSAVAPPPHSQAVSEARGTSPAVPPATGGLGSTAGVERQLSSDAAEEEKDQTGGLPDRAATWWVDVRPTKQHLRRGDLVLKVLVKLTRRRGRDAIANDGVRVAPASSTKPSLARAARDVSGHIAGAVLAAAVAVLVVRPAWLLLGIGAGLLLAMLACVALARRDIHSANPHQVRSDHTSRTASTAQSHAQSPTTLSSAFRARAVQLSRRAAQLLACGATPAAQALLRGLLTIQRWADDQGTTAASTGANQNRTESWRLQEQDVDVLGLQLVDFEWREHNGDSEGVESGGIQGSVVRSSISETSEGPEEAGKDPDEEVPGRWVVMNQGNMDEAVQCWTNTCQWRKEVDIETVLWRPQPHFDKIKELHQHFIFGQDKQGHPVFFEIIDSPSTTFRKLKAEGISVDDVVDHMIFVNEWMWRILFNDYDDVGVPVLEQASLFRVMDVRSIGLSDTYGDALAYINKLCRLMKHYPERCCLTFVINVPRSFSVVWRVLSPMLDPTVREKTRIFRGLSEYQEQLLELVDADQLPECYGGTMKVPPDLEGKPLYLASEIEKRMREHALKATAGELADWSGPPHRLGAAAGVGEEAHLDAVAEGDEGVEEGEEEGTEGSRGRRGSPKVGQHAHPRTA